MRQPALLSFLAIISSLILLPAAQADYTPAQEEAARLYQQGEYEDAYRKYRKLARDGDSFSQYRLSYMHLTGQGRKVDVIESLAWSVLAAQGRQEELVDYMHALAGMVPEDQRKKAGRKINSYMHKWGNGSDSDSSGSGTRASEAQCTGFRLCRKSGTPPRNYVPHDLWEADGSDVADREALKRRLLDLNESILKSHQGDRAGVVANKAG